MGKLLERMDGGTGILPVLPERAGRPFPYLAPLLRLHPLQSIWRLIGTMWPPLDHGVLFQRRRIVGLSLELVVESSPLGRLHFPSDISVQTLFEKERGMRLPD